MISVHFQGKPFNITVIQVYAPTTNAKKLNGSLKTYKNIRTNTKTHKQTNFLFILGDWNAKVGSQEKPIVTGKFGPGV